MYQYYTITMFCFYKIKAASFPSAYGLIGDTGGRFSCVIIILQRKQFFLCLHISTIGANITVLSALLIISIIYIPKLANSFTKLSTTFNLPFIFNSILILSHRFFKMLIIYSSLTKIVLGFPMLEI